MKRLLTSTIITSALFMAFTSVTFAQVINPVQLPNQIQTQIINEEQAKLIAQSNIPYPFDINNNIYITTKYDNDDYEIIFYDKQNFEYNKLDLNRFTNIVTEISSEKTYDKGSQTVNITDIDASNIVKTEFPDAQIIKIELEVDNGLYVYKVDFNTANRYASYEINPTTGNILERSIKLYQGVNTPATLPANTPVTLPTNVPVVNTPNNQYIGIERAKQIAMEKAPGASIKSLKLDYDDGLAKYEGELFKGNIEYSFEIDAITGIVIEWDVDYDD